MNVMRAAKKLKRIRIYTNGDYPMQVQEEKKQIIEYMITMREGGYRAKLIYNKLLTNEKTEILEY